MNARLIKAWYDIQASYYFIPGLMALGAIILAWITSTLDRHYDSEMAQSLGWFYSNKADGARAVLTTIAGSMMTVVSITFSITMVAVTTAAGQYGPRLIGNFMRDRANQVTLGTFTSTFIYCLLILRSARTGDTGSGNNLVEEFVPNVSLLVAMGLTLASVGVLIYFIHHVPETLNVGNITARIGRKLRNSIKTLFHEGDQKQISRANLDTIKRLDHEKSDIICTRAEGYIEAVNFDLLIDQARKNNWIINICHRPGDFLVRDQQVLEVFGAPEELDQDTHDALRKAFATGRERTEHQNVMFLVDELIEILARALSPGINDPFTAINCLHWLRSALTMAGRGRDPLGYKFDDEGNVRVIAGEISFKELFESVTERIEPYVLSDKNTTREYSLILSHIREACSQSQHIRLIESALKRVKHEKS